MNLRVSGLAAGVLLACGSGLADVPQPRIEVRPDTRDQLPLPGPNVFAVTLHSEPGESCLSLSPFVTATVNGEEVPDLFRGAVQATRPSLSCAPPRFDLPLDLADAPEVTVAFEEGKDRLAATFRSLGTALSLAATPPPDGHFRRGSTVGLSWEPSTDDLSGQVWLLLSSNGGTPAEIHPGTFQGGRGQFTIPATFPLGPATLRAQGVRKPAVAACEGAGSCDGSYDLGLGGTGARPVFAIVRVSLTVEP